MGLGRPRLALAVALLLALTASAQPAAASGTFTAVASGDWTDPATWSGGAIPPLDIDRFGFVEIQAGVTVTISPSTTINDAGTILNRGSLVVGGTLNVLKFLTNPTFSRVTINAGGTVSVTGTDLPVIVQNAGTTFINHGALSFGPGAQLTNQAGSLLENDGTVSVFGDAIINNLDVSRLVNDASGTISNASPSFLQRGQMTNTGSFINEAGANFSNSGGFNNFGPLTNHGAFDVVAGGVANFGPVANDGTLTVFANNAFLNLTGATFTNLPGGNVIARGAITSFVNQGHLVNQNGASFRVWASFVNNHGIFDNDGLLVTEVFGGTLLTNDGGGVINNFADGTFINGQFSVVENGDATQGFGAINSYGAFTNAGQLHVNGFVHLYAPGAMTNGLGGRITISGAASFFIIDSGVTLTNAKFGSITNGSLLETNFGGTIQNHGSIASAAPGFLLNIGSTINYCADGATVTGPVNGNPVQGIGCTTTFTQTGIPSATWGVTANGTHFSGSGPSIAANGLQGTVNYVYDGTIIAGSTRYDCTSSCSGSVQVGGTAATARYATSYRVTYRATGCALPVGAPPDQWVQAGSSPSFGFAPSVQSNDDPTSTVCIFQSDDRPSAVTGPTTVTGIYTTQYLLTVNNGASGSMAYYDAGTPVALSADAVPGSIFMNWQVDSTQYPPFVSSITVTMNGPHVATAVYVNPLDALRALRDTVDGMGLAKGRTQSLDAKLDAAIAAIGRGSDSAAVGQLKAFVDEVNAQTGKTITAAQAQVLAGAAGDILSALTSSRV